MTFQISRDSHPNKIHKERPNWASGFHAAIGIALAFASLTAQAAATCSGGGAFKMVSMPATLSVPRDALSGANLTGWILGPVDSNAFKCNTTDINSAGAGVMYVGSGTDAGIRIVGPGGGAADAQVFTTNIQGIGLAVAGRIYSNTCGWSAWTPNKPVYPNIITKVSCNGRIQPNGGQIAFAYVKINNSIPAGGNVTSETALSLYPQHMGNQLGGTWSPNYYQASSTQIIPQTCLTPNVNVDMGTVRTNVFAGVGTKATLKPFIISLLNCPSGIKTVSYQIDPVTSILDSSNSVVALASAGATGVGLQLMTSSGTRLPLRQPIAFSGYNWTGGNFSIPMLAAYYQTGSVVTPGPANTFLLFTMTYQ